MWLCLDYSHCRVLIQLSLHFLPFFFFLNTSLSPWKSKKKLSDVLQSLINYNNVWCSIIQLKFTMFLQVDVWYMKSIFQSFHVVCMTLMDIYTLLEIINLDSKTPLGSQETVLITLCRAVSPQARYRKAVSIIEVAHFIHSLGWVTYLKSAWLKWAGVCCTGIFSKVAHYLFAAYSSETVQ